MNEEKTKRMHQLLCGLAPKKRHPRYVWLDQQIVAAKEEFLHAEQMDNLPMEKMLSHLRHMAMLMGVVKQSTRGQKTVSFGALPPSPQHYGCVIVAPFVDDVAQISSRSDRMAEEMADDDYLNNMSGISRYNGDEWTIFDYGSDIVGGAVNDTIVDDEMCGDIDGNRITDDGDDDIQVICDVDGNRTMHFNPPSEQLVREMCNRFDMTFDHRLRYVCF